MTQRSAIPPEWFLYVTSMEGDDILFDSKRAALAGLNIPDRVCDVVVNVDDLKLCFPHVDWDAVVRGSIVH